MMKLYEILAIIPDKSALIEHDQLHGVSAHGYTAVMATRPRRAIKLPQNRKDALQFAAARQAMLEALMPIGPVLPFRPDYHLATKDVPNLIAANEHIFKRLSNKLRGKVQFQVSVHWDREHALAKFRDAPEMAEVLSHSRTTQNAFSRAVQALSSRLSHQMVLALEEVSAEMITLPMTPDMLLNSVILLDEQKLKDLDVVVERIDAIWTEGLRIRQIGPAPAASFALLHPQQIGAAKITLAERTLGVSAQSGTAVITQARRDALLRSPTRADEIKSCADILAAASRVGRSDPPLYLCTVGSEDQVTPLYAAEVA